MSNSSGDDSDGIINNHYTKILVNFCQCHELWISYLTSLTLTLFRSPSDQGGTPWTLTTASYVIGGIKEKESCKAEVLEEGLLKSIHLEKEDEIGLSLQGLLSNADC